MRIKKFSYIFQHIATDTDEYREKSLYSKSLKRKLAIAHCRWRVQYVNELSFLLRSIGNEILTGALKWVIQSSLKYVLRQFRS